MGSAAFREGQAVPPQLLRETAASNFSFSSSIKASNCSSQMSSRLSTESMFSSFGIRKATTVQVELFGPDLVFWMSLDWKIEKTSAGL